MRWLVVALLICAAPAMAQSRHAALADALREARSALCPRCADDIERTGINHPMLRMMRAEVAIDVAKRRLDEAAAANRELNEDVASFGLHRAQRLLRSIP
jgi:hypothetical protein